MVIGPATIGPATTVIGPATLDWPRLFVFLYTAGILLELFLQSTDFECSRFAKDS